MATPIIPLQPYIPTGEGEGAAYILPNTERLSATDIFRGEIDQRKARRLTEQKAIQDSILNIGKLGGKGLPGHRRQFANEYQNIINWYQQQRSAGKDPSKPNSEENFEMMRKLNDLSAMGTVMGEVYDADVKNMSALSRNENAYKSGKYLEARQGLDAQNLKDVNLSNIPTLEGAFDAEKYKKKILGNIPESEQLINERSDPMAANQYLYDVVGSKDPKIAARNAMNPQTEEGQDYIAMMKERAASDPATLETALIQSPEYNKNLAAATKNNNGKPLSPQQVEDVKVATTQDKKAYDNILNKAAELKAVEDFSASAQYGKGVRVLGERWAPTGGGGKPNEKKAIPFVTTVTPKNVATENPNALISKLYNTLVFASKNATGDQKKKADAALAEMENIGYEQRGIALGTTKMYSEDQSTMIDAAQNLTFDPVNNEYQIQGSVTEGSGRFKSTGSKISVVEEGKLDELAATIARRENITKEEAWKKIRAIKAETVKSYKGVYSRMEKALATATGKNSTYPGNKPATPAAKPVNKWDAAKRKK